MVTLSDPSIQLQHFVMIRINGNVVRGWGLEDPTLDLEASRPRGGWGRGARAGHETVSMSSFLAFLQVYCQKCTLLCFALLCFALLCFALLCFVLFCFVFLVLFCFVLFCFVLFCFVFVSFCFALLCVLSVTIHVLK